MTRCFPLKEKEKENKEINNLNKIYIHISRETEKSEIKKERKKLNKIPGDFKKFLIVENIDSYKFKKLEFDNLKIV
jgi:hypothetical protein